MSYVPMGEEDAEAAARAAAGGYVETIAALAAGDDMPIARLGDDNGLVIDDLLDESVDDSEPDRDLDRFTEIDDFDVRHLRRGELEPPDGLVIERELRPLDAEERERVEKLIGAMPQMGESSDLIEASLRVGAGVASYALPRYYLLFDGQMPGPDGDYLVEIREVRDAPVGGFPILPGRRFVSNGERVDFFQRGAQQTRHNDPRFGVADIGPLSYKARTLTGANQGLSKERLEERIRDRRFTREDLEACARKAGALLARAHARSRNPSGESSLPAIAAALAGRGEGMVEETAAFARHYGQRVADDHRLFGILCPDGECAFGY
jgi:hypothetical protein